MQTKKFNRLINRGLLTAEELDGILLEAKAGSEYPEALLLRRGVAKHEILFCLSEYYGCPYVEYDEGIMISALITKRMDMEGLKLKLWFPISLRQDSAEVVAYSPDDPAVIDDIRKTLKTDNIKYNAALPGDILRIIENNQDLNPGFPPSAGRTPLAKVRTFLADRRSMLACYRTSLAKGRTGLAFLRTGISFMTISLVLLRIFGFGLQTILEALLFAAGIIIAADGISWYLPARKTGMKKLDCHSTEPTFGTTVLEVINPGDNPSFCRTGPVPDAAELRAGWSSLSPVMRRRFLASDRTDMAEERTTLAEYRTVMARARTGLAFTRTGAAFVGLGIALLRQFHTGPWTVLDIGLILAGTAMAVEGFFWYLPGREAGVKGLECVQEAEKKETIWDSFFPPEHKKIEMKLTRDNTLPVRACYAPGIWATTGVALERTVLADRRNVMARLRTVMARARTGMAFIRTGMSVSAVGSGLLVYFGTSVLGWTIFNSVLILTGLLLVADGLYWYIPADKIRRQLPYCFGDMEITVPDYGTSCRNWKTAVFSYDDF